MKIVCCKNGFWCKDGLKIAIKREQTKTCFQYAEQERFIKRPTRYQPRATPWVNNGVVDCALQGQKPYICHNAYALAGR